MKIPKFATKKEFLYGSDDPALMAEVDRFGWYNANSEYNIRIGFYEYILSALVAGFIYFETRMRNRGVMMRSQMNGMWYPGRLLFSPFGCITNTDELYWWQRPLSEFHNQGEIWFYNQSRFGYANYLKKRDEMEKVEGLMSA
eukprot:GILK01015930.1.p1 GENE.GILK01015930.1~~GILK01015930.1.p1  ORF type:complete len:142 (+),score=10.04 GILK01015930.1:194-619(+)